MSHCLAEVLQRWRTGELSCDIVYVVANHPHIEEFEGLFKVPFHHFPFPTGDKAATFDRVEALLKEHAADFTVLARLMQIIPDAFAEAHVGRMINIQHNPRTAVFT